MLHTSGVMKICSLETLEVEETAGKEMDNWKAFSRGNVILKIANGVLIQDG